MARPVSVFIADALVTIAAGSCRIDSRIEERSTASFTVIDLTGALTYQRGQTVKIYEGDSELLLESGLPILLETGDSILLEYANLTLLFAGFIETPDRERDGSGLLHTIVCKDNHYLADKRLVVKSYTSQTLSYIVTDIITDYLSAEGITAGTIQTGPTIAEAIVNYVSATQCFDALKELSGFVWRINPNKSLDFVQRDTNLAPWSLTSTEIVDKSAHRSDGNPAYRNRQYIRGGKGLTTVRAETFTGNAVLVAFTVGYPIGLAPTATVNAVSQTVGIKGVDTGKDCYWNKGDATVTFTTAPGNGLAVVITYYGQYPLITRADSYTAIAARLAIEGGTGIVEDIVTEAQHETSAAQNESARNKLQIYCQDAERFTFQTRTSGLLAGQLLAVTYAAFGFTAHDMLIESVEISEEDSTHLIYSVTAITGPVLGSWSRFFSNILTRQDKSIKLGDGLLLVLLQQQETLDLTEAVYIYNDDFNTLGLNNRWLNSAPISAGSLHNVQHERVKLTETPSIGTHEKNNYLWDDATSKWDLASWG